MHGKRPKANVAGTAPHPASGQAFFLYNTDMQARHGAAEPRVAEGTDSITETVLVRETAYACAEFRPYGRAWIHLS